MKIGAGVFVLWRKGQFDFDIRSPKIQMIDYKAQIEWVCRVMDIILKMYIIKWEEIMAFSVCLMNIISKMYLIIMLEETYSFMAFAFYLMNFMQSS